MAVHISRRVGNAPKTGACHRSMFEYELMYIVPTSFTDEEAGAVEQQVGAMLAKANASVLTTTRLGKLRFAYPIKGQAFGNYVLVRFQAEPAAVAGLNESLRLSPDKVVRHLILRADEAGDAKYQLVQFQEVNVEDRGDRTRRPAPGSARPARTDKPTAEDAKAQKEGVAALEGKEKSTAAETLSAEELEKKIDQALEEKA